MGSSNGRAHKRQCLNKIKENNGMSCLWYAIPLLLKYEVNYKNTEILIQFILH